MPTHRRPFLRPFLLIVAVAIPACSRSAPTVAAPDQTVALEQLGRFYQYLTHERLRSPSNANDLNAYPPESIPDALPLIQNGDIVVIWGAGYSASSTLIIAYEKDVPTNGGRVLLQNGSVKSMTATEFQKAPKAGK